MGISPRSLAAELDVIFSVREVFFGLFDGTMGEPKMRTAFLHVAQFCISQAKYPQASTDSTRGSFQSLLNFGVCFFIFASPAFMRSSVCSIALFQTFTYSSPSCTV